MATQRNHRHGTITISCDECGEDYVADTDDFHDAIDEYKEMGHTVRMEDGAWHHYCEDCK